MNGSREPTMAAIVAVLGETYLDDGIAMWLDATHRSGLLRSFRPIDVCKSAHGRAAVLAAAESLTGMVAT